MLLIWLHLELRASQQQQQYQMLQPLMKTWSALLQLSQILLPFLRQQMMQQAKNHQVCVSLQHTKQQLLDASSISYEAIWPRLVFIG